MTFMTSYLATIGKKLLVCLINGLTTTTTPTTVSAQTSKANISAQGAQNPLKKSQNFQRDKEIWFFMEKFPGEIIQYISFSRVNW